jgi:hypothetical protein
MQRVRKSWLQGAAPALRQMPERFFVATCLSVSVVFYLCILNLATILVQFKLSYQFFQFFRLHG